MRRKKSETDNMFSYGSAEPDPYENDNSFQEITPQAGDGRAEMLFSIIEEPIQFEDDEQFKLHVPIGSILTGVSITGIDAPTTAESSDSPLPVLIRIKKEAVLPNLFELEEVRECFVLMAGYGDLASERVYLRGEVVSCMREDGQVIETKFAAFAVGEDGKAGLKGTLVSRNSKVLINAMASGFMAGLGSAFNVNPVPVISTDSTGTQDYNSVFSTNAVQGGAAQGAATTFEKLADYYMELADAMHPVIEVGAGRVVDIVITQGVEL
ncbi:TraB/VirB10 family protein [Psychromonas sp. KJ10-2]|uniref:TraB/VirB10 family protein n=1 Tax=Psychromonas sp. KJ10-2 TaxID=3391822 RepID=UPI0039B5396E